MSSAASSSLLVTNSDRAWRNKTLAKPSRACTLCGSSFSASAYSLDASWRLSCAAAVSPCDVRKSTIHCVTAPAHPDAAIAAAATAAAASPLKLRCSTCQEPRDGRDDVRCGSQQELREQRSHD